MSSNQVSLFSMIIEGEMVSIVQMSTGFVCVGVFLCYDYFDLSLLMGRKMN